MIKALEVHIKKCSKENICWKIPRIAVNPFGTKPRPVLKKAPMSQSRKRQAEKSR